MFISKSQIEHTPKFDLEKKLLEDSKLASSGTI